MHRSWAWPALLMLVGCADVVGISALPSEPPQDAALDSTRVPPSDAEAGGPADGASIDGRVPDVADAGQADASGDGASDSDGPSDAPTVPEGGDAGSPVVIGVTVSGLVPGASLVLQNNGADNQSVTSNGTSAFSTPVPAGSAYAVTVAIPPMSPGELCVVTNGSGIASTTTPPNVTVMCSPVAAVSAGLQHTCAVLATGGVVCWGDNSYSELGSATLAYSAVPVDVGLFQVQAVAVGFYHSCAMVMGGDVYCWGIGTNGQLGNGTTGETSAPVQVMLPGDGGTAALLATAIASGGAHTCAIAVSGTVYCWGDNYDGDLGNGETTPSSVPVPVRLSAGATVVALGAGEHHSCAALSNGAVQCWGANDQGQLGVNVSTGYSTVPVTVSGINTATSVSTGDAHSCALLSSGAIACWGQGGNGQLGDGQSTESSVPVITTGLGVPAAAVSAGYEHTCALGMDQNLYCWGFNVFGQVGNGTTTEAPAPVPVANASGAAGVSAGGYHSCGLVNGGVRCWGYDDYGQLGNGFAVAAPTPRPVSGLTGAVGIAMGEQHTCASLADGGAACWGYGLEGELGNGGALCSSVPQPVVGLGGAVQSIAAGGATSCAVLTNGSLQCWGFGGDGELGGGSGVGALTPTTVPNVAPVAQVSVGQGSVCAARQSSVDCWGSNAKGQCGTGSTGGDELSATAVSGLPTGTTSSLSLGPVDACAVFGGVIACWGDDQNGQLGNAVMTADEPTPVAVMGSGTVQQIAAGAAHTCALAPPTGSVECWGANSSGQLGNGTTNSTEVAGGSPVLVGATAITSGWYHTCALMTGGTVQCWGWNAFGQLGDGTLTTALSPTPVPGLQGVVALSAGLAHTCAVLSDGAVECWGWDGNGQLGDGLVAQSSTAVVVR